jgi:hypothetical protein
MTRLGFIAKTKQAYADVRLDRLVDNFDVLQISEFVADTAPDLRWRALTGVNIDLDGIVPERNRGAPKCLGGLSFSVVFFLISRIANRSCPYSALLSFDSPA